MTIFQRTELIQYSKTITESLSNEFKIIRIVVYCAAPAYLVFSIIFLSMNSYNVYPTLSVNILTGIVAIYIICFMVTGFVYSFKVHKIFVDLVKNTKSASKTKKLMLKNYCLAGISGFVLLICHLH